jgi:hypothetical protein
MISVYSHHHHHRPINVPTAGAQALYMDYTKGERAITHHVCSVLVGIYISLVNNFIAIIKHDMKNLHEG